jgi:hypothetical protein
MGRSGKRGKEVAILKSYKRQEVVHDLIYKELKGVPLQDEKDIAMAINGMAHCGEAALQLLERIQTARVQKDERQFHVPGEVAFWLRDDDRIDKIIHEAKLDDVLPVMSALGLGGEVRDSVTVIFSWVLFDIIEMAELDTPGELKPVLYKTDPNSKLESELLPSANMSDFGLDITLWAVTRLCLQITDWALDWQTDTRIKAWVIVNAFNLALTENSAAKLVKAVYVRDVTQHQVPGHYSSQEYCDALFSAVTKSIVY